MFSPIFSHADWGPKMTPEEMTQIMDRAGLRLKDLAMISDVTYRQVLSWRSGQYQVPRMLSFLLLALDDGRIDLEWLEKALETELREKTT